MSGEGGTTVLVAGATGVLGRPLMGRLAEAGHTAVGFSRRGGDAVRSVDALDAGAVRALAEEVRPDVVVNLLTAIPENLNPRRIGEAFAPTNRLRIEGTANLIAAAPEAHHVAESIAFVYDPAPGLATEEDPLWVDPPAVFAPILDAVRTLEREALAARGAVLRLGYLHGPGTAFDPAGGTFTDQVRKRRLPLAGPSTGVLSFLHVDDAAAAFVAAIERRFEGVLNVVEDDPQPVREWLPAYAAKLGAKPPLRVPRWLARLASGAYGDAFYNDLRGASNAAARERLGWAPAHRFP
jgi:nucleoside-diphosphate-sugar epimerase